MALAGATEGAHFPVGVQQCRHRDGLQLRVPGEHSVGGTVGGLGGLQRGRRGRQRPGVAAGQQDAVQRGFVPQCLQGPSGGADRHHLRQSAAQDAADRGHPLSGTERADSQPLEHGGEPRAGAGADHAPVALVHDGDRDVQPRPQEVPVGVLDDRGAGVRSVAGKAAEGTCGREVGEEVQRTAGHRGGERGSTLGLDPGDP